MHPQIQGATEIKGPGKLRGCLNMSKASVQVGWEHDSVGPCVSLDHETGNTSAFFPKAKQKRARGSLSSPGNPHKVHRNASCERPDSSFRSWESRSRNRTLQTYQHQKPLMFLRGVSQNGTWTLFSASFRLGEEPEFIQGSWRLGLVPWFPANGKQPPPQSKPPTNEQCCLK